MKFNMVYISHIGNFVLYPKSFHSPVILPYTGILESVSHINTIFSDYESV